MTKRKLTPKDKNEILAILSVGCTRAAAARSVRCSPYILRREMADHPQFAEDIAKAEGGSELFYLSRIRNATQKEQHWRAAAWLLERRFPKHYGVKKPENMTSEQVQNFMTSCMQIIADSLTNKKRRNKMLDRLAKEMERLEE
jgi:hypothetical protein